MDKQTKEKLEQKKKYIRDYLEMAQRLGIDAEARKKTLDLLLDDITKLLDRDR